MLENRVSNRVVRYVNHRNCGVLWRIVLIKMNGNITYTQDWSDAIVVVTAGKHIDVLANLMNQAIGYS